VEDSFGRVAEQQLLEQRASVVADNDEIRAPLFGSGHDFFTDHAIAENLIAWDIPSAIPHAAEQRLGPLVNLFDRFDKSHLVWRRKETGDDVYESERCTQLSCQSDRRVGCTKGGLAIIHRHQNSFE